MLPTLEESRERLVEALTCDDPLLVQLSGNTGDALIDAGAQQLIADAGLTIPTYHHSGPCPGTGEDWHGCTGDCPAELHEGTLIISGGGAWREGYGHPLTILRRTRAARVVVLPSTYDATWYPVRRTLGCKPRLTTFARELRSHHTVPCSKLAHDTSFFFDYTPYLGNSIDKDLVLHAYREDEESAGLPLPRRNVDVSLEYPFLDDWLTVLSSAGEVHTDRAHVMIGAALLGARVRYREGAYWKNTELAAWLSDYDVRPL